MVEVDCTSSAILQVPDCASRRRDRFPHARLTVLRDARKGLPAEECSAGLPSLAKPEIARCAAGKACPPVCSMQGCRVRLHPREALNGSASMSPVTPARGADPEIEIGILT